MTTAAALLRGGARGAAVLVLFAVSVLGVAYVSSEPTQLRAAVTVGLILVVAAVGIAWPQRLLYGIAGWLIVMGLVRRVLTLVAPSTGPDPLLLVEPAAVALLLVVIAHRGPFRGRSALSTCVALMSGIIAISALNPAQGGLTVGVAGLLFLLVPTLGFWIGRSLCTDAVFERLLKLVAAVALPVAAYGLYQTFVGFPRWDERWIVSVAQAYQALNVGAAVRPFSTLPSSAEYAYVLGVGLAVWLAFGLRVLRLPVTLAAVALLGTGLVLESSRLIVFLSAAALIAMAVSRLRISAPAAAVVVLLSFLATSAVVGRLAPDYYATNTTGALLSHQLQGLSNPFDATSTFFIHTSLVTNGLRSGIAHPAGLGAGTVSQAASRFGGVGRQSEADPSNLAIAAGVPGLVTYLVLATLAFVRAYSLARIRRDALALSALAITTIVFLQWFNGGQYGIALLLWITLGWIDRSWILQNAAKTQTRAPL
ncbi:MAG TPA: hypothetical protein VH538_00870 [Gaiellaceae bacterium]